MKTTKKNEEGDGSKKVAVAFFAEDEEEVAALQHSATMPLQTKQTQKKGTVCYS
jgi:hypothetical protein